MGGFFAPHGMCSAPVQLSLQLGGEGVINAAQLPIFTVPISYKCKLSLRHSIFNNVTVLLKFHWIQLKITATLKKKKHMFFILIYIIQPLWLEAGWFH